MTIMAMTTSNSSSVKAALRLLFVLDCGVFIEGLPLARLAGLVVIHIVLIVHGAVGIVIGPGIAEADVIKTQVIGAIEAK